MYDPIYYATVVPSGRSGAPPPKKIEDNFLRLFSLTSDQRKQISDQLSKVTFHVINVNGTENPQSSEEEYEKNNFEPIYCDVEKYSLLQQLKQIHSHKDARKFISQVYPYENVNNSIFMNRCGLKLANLDKIFQLTGHLTGAVNKQIPGDFIFCDIAGGPGGFTQYLQWRRSESMGFGITYKKIIDWNNDRLDATRFTPIYGSKADGDGNLYFEWNFFVKTVKDLQPQGVDLVVADGGFDVTKNENQDRQEFLSARLILIEILMGILLCKEDTAPFVFKVFDTVSQVSAFLLLLCSLAFQEIHLWKPVMSRWTNAERYVICRKRYPDVDQIADLLIKMIDMQTEEKRISDVLGIIMPENFIQWLTERNNESINLQTKTASQMINLITNKKVEDLEKINSHQVLIVLDLPGERYQREQKKKD